MDVLISGICFAAEAFAMGTTVGTIAPGYEADLLPVKGHALEDITAVSNIALVMMSGHIERNTPR